MSLTELRRPSRLADRARRDWMINDLVLLLVAVCGVVLVVLRDDFLPPRFFYDGDLIQSIAQGVVSSAGDQSYGRVAGVYRFLGLSDNPLAASLASYLLALLVLVAVRIQFRDVPPTKLVTAYACTYILLAAVFLGFYSKDAFVLVIAMLALRAGRSLKWEAAIVLAMTAYGLSFRTYWLLIVILFVGFRLLTRKNSSAVRILSLCVLALVALSIAIPLTLHVPADHFRTVVNVGRLDSADAATAILPVVPGDGMVSGVINVALTFVMLAAPLTLARLGGAYYIGLSIVIAWLWLTIVFRGFRVARIPRPAHRLVGTRSLALLLSFLTVQAIFEPDYGSALRHLTPLLPLGLVVVWATVGVRKKNEHRDTVMDD